MFTKAVLLIALQSVIYQVQSAAVVNDGKGEKCVADRMRDLANAAVPYSNQIVCEIEKTFLNCLSSAPKPSRSLHIVQHLLSCTRLRLMKEYDMCDLGNYNCDFPQELTDLPEDQKFEFSQIEVDNFGKVRLEGCLNIFTYLQRYAIHPCTETAISALCMKPLIRGLGLFESNNKHFSSLHKEFTCECADVAQHLCKDPYLCPNDVFNRNWKSSNTRSNDNEAEFFDIDDYGKCLSMERNKTSQIDKCLKMDFESVGKCLQKRYMSYADISFGDTKLPFDRHCDIENDLYNCVSEDSATETDESCKNKNNFIIWVRVQSYITMKILDISQMCSKSYDTVSLDDLLTNKLPTSIKTDLKNQIGIIDKKLTTPCSQKALDTCYYVRSYMHDFLVHPCIEWMMFYRCVRDNLDVCGEPAAADFITQFLEGQTQISINKNNQWNHNECALLNKMQNYKKTDDITTLNVINPFKKNIDN